MVYLNLNVESFCCWQSAEQTEKIYCNNIWYQHKNLYIIKREVLILFKRTNNKVAYGEEYCCQDVIILNT